MLGSLDDESQPPCGVTVNVSVVIATRPLVVPSVILSSLIRHNPLGVSTIAFSEKLYKQNISCNIKYSI